MGGDGTTSDCAMPDNFASAGKRGCHVSVTSRSALCFFLNQWIEALQRRELDALFDEALDLPTALARVLPEQRASNGRDRDLQLRGRHRDDPIAQPRRFPSGG